MPTEQLIFWGLAALVVAFFVQWRTAGWLGGLVMLPLFVLVLVGFILWSLAQAGAANALATTVSAVVPKGIL